MDLILMRFAQARLTEMSAAELSEYEQFLEENDQDLYQWVSGQMPAPARWQAMVGEISAVIGAGMTG